MYAKIKFDGNLVGIAKRFGMAPCQILVLNKATREDELFGREILIKPELAMLEREVGGHFVLRGDIITYEG